MDFEPIDPEFESREPDEYEDGWAAFTRGIDRDCCPYSVEVQRELWLMGWDEACIEDEEDLP